MTDSRLFQLMAVPALLALLLGLAVFRELTAPVDIYIARLFGEGALAFSDPRWREGLRDLTALGSFVVLGLAVVSACAILLAVHRARLAGLLLASALGATATSTVLKHLTSRARPDIVEPLALTFTSSFPSGHAFLSMVVFMTIGGLLAMASHHRLQRKVILGLCLALAVLIGLSRIALGVHWLSDVLAGWLLGIAWSASFILVARRMAAPAAR